MVIHGDIPGLENSPVMVDSPEIRWLIPNVINAQSQALYNGKSPHLQMANNG